MEVHARTSAHEAAVLAADLVAEAVVRGARTLLLAVGRSPEATYAELARRSHEGTFATSELVAVQLDGYWGLPPGDPRRLGTWLERSVLAPWGIPQERVVRLAEDGSDPEAACARYTEQVARHGGVDLAILGLGPNGHLGFNEPPSGPTASTRPVDLSAASLLSNAAYWGERSVPARAVTAGMDIVLAARQVLLVVDGASKAEVLRRCVLEAPTDELPASHLQGHPDAVVVADSLAWPG
ncbi:MAG: glucosamine/galactosamine-6-phosphate isomerase [Acidimicrobiaceae bacterium]|nr:glucosamine/galactosamine-6-phosphate isomerase [Acidimicrobiaceae bacterium]